MNLPQITLRSPDDYGEDFESLVLPWMVNGEWSSLPFVLRWSCSSTSISSLSSASLARALGSITWSYTSRIACGNNRNLLAIHGSDDPIVACNQAKVRQEGLAETLPLQVNELASSRMDFPHFVWCDGIIDDLNDEVNVVPSQVFDVAAWDNDAGNENVFGDGRQRLGRETISMTRCPKFVYVFVWWVCSVVPKKDRSSPKLPWWHPWSLLGGLLLVLIDDSANRYNNYSFLVDHAVERQKWQDRWFIRIISGISNSLVKDVSALSDDGKESVPSIVGLFPALLRSSAPLDSHGQYNGRDALSHIGQS